MKRICIFLIVMFGTVPAFGQWFYIDGGLGTQGATLAFGVHDSSLFESGSNGVVDRYISPQNWAEADNGIDFTQGAITTFASLGQYFLAGSAPPSQGVATLSTDNGGSWKTVLGGPVGTNGTYFFAQYATRIARSVDNGKFWEHLSPPAGNFYTGTGRYVLSGTSTDGVWRSMDSGGTWSRDTTPINTINSFAFIDSVTFGANGKIIKSPDSGSHWTDVSIPGRNTSVIVSDSTFLFAGTDSGVYVSLNYGTTWRAVNENLLGRGPGYPQVTALCVFDTLLVAGVNAGAGYGYASARPIKEMVDTTPASVVQTTLPGDTIAVYPNPAMGTVTILADGTFIYAVSVLDVLGEDVLDMPNLRESDITLDLSKIPSGTYFLRIETGNGSVLRKVVVQH
jgi:hypothetical protein